jgi:hypothetical protein
MASFTDGELKDLCKKAMLLDPSGRSPLSQMCAEELRARLSERAPPAPPKITVVVIRGSHE